MDDLMDEFRSRCRLAFEATFGDSIRKALEQPIGPGPTCLCAWYEHCEICSKPYEPDEPGTIQEYGAVVRIRDLRP